MITMLLLYIGAGLSCLAVLFWLFVNLYVWFVLNGGKSVKYKNDRRLDGKTALITGGNAGVGKAVATDLAGRGARVLLACRNEERAKETIREVAEKTGNVDIHFVDCDLADLESVRRAAQTILQTEERLDLLINNAAVFSGFVVREKDGILDPRPHLPPTKQNYDSAFGTNHLGHFLLTNLLVDLLKNSAPSRIIVVSSVGHREVRGRLEFNNPGGSGIKYPRLVGYHISKLANVLHAKELARRLEKTGVTTYAVNPGAVFSDAALRNRKNYGYSLLIALITTYLAKFAQLTPTEGAQTILYCALDEKLAGETGKYYDSCEEKAAGSLAQDESLAHRLWQESELMIQ